MIRQEKRKKQKNNGITLIALVITIIVLLILAGVTISTLTGENGILAKASEAKEKTMQANAEEQVEIAVTGSIGTDGKIRNGDLKTNLDKIENITGVPDEITDSNFPLTVNIDGYDVTIKKDGSVILGEYIPPGNPDKITGIFKEASTINGEEGNKNNPVIPEEFKPINEGEANWGDGTSEPPGINEGLVIEDSEGNQYVWIPVDGVLGDDGITVENAVDGEIILGRYVFTYQGEIDISKTPSVPGEEIVQYRDSYVESTIGGGNTPANNLEAFINSVRTNGGYYIARFEASYGTDKKANSKVSNGYIEEYGVAPTQEGYLWNNITQLEAAKACQNLYTTINSDLVNSYAWDTAILFIRKNQNEDETPYSRQPSLNNELTNTGNTGDVQCNIYDMASNCREWTTETHNPTSNGPCSCIGGAYDLIYDHPNMRNYRATTLGGTNDTFRSILYL